MNPPYKSIANAPHTIVAILEALGKARETDFQWWQSNNMSMDEVFPQNLKQEIEALSDTLKYIVEVGSSSKVNQFLKDNGFDLSLPKITDPTFACAASILEVLVHWLPRYEAKFADLELKSGELTPAIRMRNVGEITNIRGHKHPIVKLRTKTDETVYVTQYDKKPPQGSVALNNLIQEWRLKSPAPHKLKYSGQVTFPMVDYNKTGKIAELIQAYSKNSNGEVTNIICEARYQHIIKINHHGALAKAAAIVFTAGSAASSQPIRYPVIIDGPFIIWFERTDGIVPFCAYIGESDMKNPGVF